MKDLQLNKQMGEAVINHLRQFAEIPTGGILAGQAVASAISELYGDGSAVAYNDLDVFAPYAYGGEGKGARAKREALRAIQTKAFATLEVEDGYGGQSISMCHRYAVVKTSRTGLLNEVFCDFESYGPEALLCTFDMNCVQVGVDLSLKQLYWTKEFETFLRTRQLEIVSMHTPILSLIRYFKKLGELDGVYGNDERMAELVAAAYQAELKGLNPLTSFDTLPNKELVGHRFGSVYKARLDKVFSSIAPSFELIESEHKEQQVYSLVPRFEADQRLMKVAHNMGSPIHLLPRISQALHEGYSKGASTRLAYILEQVKPTQVVGSWLKQGAPYVKANVTPAQMKQIDDVAAAHDIGYFLRNASLTEQFRRVAMMKREAKARGLWIYGVLEGHSRSQRRTQDCVLDENAFAQMLDAEEAKMLEVLAPERLPVLSIQGFTIRDLRTRLALHSEGKDMHHCVGGYGEAVAAGNTRILSLRMGDTPDSWLTVEARKARKGYWTIAQIRGLQNRTATQAERDAAREYLNVLGWSDFVGANAALAARWASPFVTAVMRVYDIIKPSQKKYTYSRKRKLRARLGLSLVQGAPHVLDPVTGKGHWADSKGFGYLTACVRVWLKNRREGVITVENDEEAIPF